jgi:membrane protease YdiL (CAAX protease family)
LRARRSNDDRGRLLDIAITPEDVAGPPPGRWPLWKTLGWGLVVMTVSTVVQGLAIVAAGVLDLFHGTSGPSTSFYQLLVSDAASGDVLATTVIVSDLACVAVIFLIVALSRLSVTDYLAANLVRARVLLKWAGILLAYVVLTSGVATLFHIDFGGAVMGDILTDSRRPWLFWIAVVLAAPLFEEVFFRGFLFRGFEASFLKTTGTVILTAILWAALHVQYNAYGIAFIAGAGILFGLARAKTGSLLVPLALHAAMNLAETVAMTVYGA